LYQKLTKITFKYVNVFIHTIKMGISSKREKDTLKEIIPNF